jgi:hypothetical protein
LYIFKELSKNDIVENLKESIVRLILQCKYIVYIILQRTHIVRIFLQFKQIYLNPIFMVQEYVSDLTSKYLASGHSPWQVQVIGRDRQLGLHCLVRVHHLLLHQEQLVLGDFLPLNRTHWSCADTHEPILGSPFASIYAEPSALPRLHEKLTESFSNIWNEFLCNNDPTERPEILKKKISLWQCAKIAVIVCFSTLKEIIR